MAEEFFTADELSQFDTDAGYAIEGMGTPSRDVLYERVGAATANVTTGTTAESGASGTVKMLRLNSKAEQKDGVEQGPVTFMARQSRVAALVSGFTGPKRLDRLTDASGVHELLDFSEDPLSIFWFFRCKKIPVPA